MKSRDEGLYNINIPIKTHPNSKGLKNIRKKCHFEASGLVFGNKLNFFAIPTSVINEGGWVSLELHLAFTSSVVILPRNQTPQEHIYPGVGRDKKKGFYNKKKDGKSGKYEFPRIFFFAI